MSPITLPVPHITQRHPGECLAACAAMLLTYLGLSVTYGQLCKILQVRSGIGAPAFHIRALTSFGVTVTYEAGTLDVLHQHLINNQPSIAFVEAGQLPYWDENSSHAVVVVGMEEKNMYLNDPALNRGPVRVSQGDFDLAWLEQDEFYATISLKS